MSYVRQEFVVKVLNESENELPSYAKEGDSGMDVRSKDDFEIYPGEVKIIQTGLKVRLPYDGLEIQIRPRSGMSSKTKMRIANPPGTLDCIPKFAKIKTVDGDVCLGDIMVKDTKVVSYDAETNVTETDDVEDIWSVGEKDVIKITYDDGSETYTTKTQLILTSTGWKTAESLSLTDEVISVN